MELLDRLAHFIVPPRVHRHRYSGVFAPNSPLRAQVIFSAGPDEALEARLTEAAQQMGLIAVDSEESNNKQTEDGDKAQRLVQDKCEEKYHAKADAKANRRYSVMWAMLIARIYERLPLKCHCGQSLKIIAFITQPVVVEKILDHLGEPTQPPPIAPARDPPEQQVDRTAILL